MRRLCLMDSINDESKEKGLSGKEAELTTMIT